MGNGMGMGPLPPISGCLQIIILCSILGSLNPISWAIFLISSLRLTSLNKGSWSCNPNSAQNGSKQEVNSQCVTKELSQIGPSELSGGGITMSNFIDCSFLRRRQLALPIHCLNLQKIPNLIPTRQKILPSALPTSRTGRPRRQHGLLSRRWRILSLGGLGGRTS